MSWRSDSQTPGIREALSLVSNNHGNVGSMLNSKDIKERVSLLPKADNAMPYLGS